MKNLYFFYANWLRSGCRWYSPYHQIAFELATRVRQATVHRLLDCGFLHRAEALHHNDPGLFTKSALAKLEYLRGNYDAAVRHLVTALTEHKPLEQQRAIKLMARLSPAELISWAGRTGRTRLLQCLKTAIASEPIASSKLVNPSGDEHLLNANGKTLIKEKLEHLNAYWQEMGLSPIEAHSTTCTFDINALAPHQSPSRTPATSATLSISIIMTVFNGAPYLRASLLSMLHQTNFSTEIIIIDDASTDDTWNVICRLKSEFPDRIKPKRLSKNIGTYAAKNIALDLCNKEYIAFQDADDWSHPERLKRAIDWLALNPEHIAVTSRYIRVDLDGRFYSPGVWPLRQWSPNTLVVRRAPVLDAIGRFDNVRVGADTDYFERIRAHFGDRRILFQKEVMLIAMSLPSSLMHKKSTGINQFGHSAKRIAYRDVSAERLLKIAELRESPYFPRPH